MDVGTPPFEPRSGLDWIMWLLAASSVVDDREACGARHISKMVLSIVQLGPPPRTVDTTIFEMWLGSRLGPNDRCEPSQVGQSVLYGELFVGRCPWVRAGGRRLNRRSPCQLCNSTEAPHRQLLCSASSSRPFRAAQSTNSCIDPTCSFSWIA